MSGPFDIAEVGDRFAVHWQGGEYEIEFYAEDSGGTRRRVVISGYALARLSAMHIELLQDVVESVGGKDLSRSVSAFYPESGV